MQGHRLSVLAVAVAEPHGHGHLERMGILAAHVPFRSIVKKVEAGVEGSRGCGEVLPPGWLN